MPRLALLAALVFGWLAFAPAASAQNVVVTVTTNPPGAYYVVDDLRYYQQQTFNWPAGSTHTLNVASLIQPYQTAPTVFNFLNWTDAQGTFTNAEIWVTATPTVTLYTAVFSATNTLTTAISLICGTAQCGGVPGVVELGGSPFTGPQPEPYGSAQVLTAVPNPGYVFAFWNSGDPNQALSGNVDVATMNAPVLATANFLIAAPVTLASVPPGLQLLADSVPTTTPFTESFGWGTSHSLTAISPQRDSTGNYWVFSSWSDGGAGTHIITVPQHSQGYTLTATFVPDVTYTFLTSPVGLNCLTVDGQSAATGITRWTFNWAAGQTHTFSAPATFTDPQGNLWGFTGWSNGGTQSQTITVGTTGMNLVATYQQLGQLFVNSTLAGIAVSVNGSSCATPCPVQAPVNTSVTVSAPATVAVGPGARQVLVGWSNGTAAGNLTIPVPAKATTVTADYQLQYLLTLATSPVNEGTFNLQPASPDGYYNAGTTVNVSLSPLPGYQFRNWSGDLNGIEPFGMVLLSQARSATALLASVPFLPTGAVANAAGTTPTNAMAAGSAISIFGLNLTPVTEQATGSPMPQTLGGVTVAIGSRLLPLYFVSPGQINAQLPPDLLPGESSLVVTTPAQATVTANFTIAQDAPGLFSLTLNKKTYAIAFHPDGSLVTEASPAKAGETITLYGTGFGPSTPARPEGQAVPLSPAYALNDSASVQLGTADFAASTAYALPGAVGIDMVQFAIPAGAPTGGDFQLTVTIGKVVSNTVLLPVH